MGHSTGQEPPRRASREQVQALLAGQLGEPVRDPRRAMAAGGAAATASPRGGQPAAPSTQALRSPSPDEGTAVVVIGGWGGGEKSFVLMFVSLALSLACPPPRHTSVS